MTFLCLIKVIDHGKRKLDELTVKQHCTIFSHYKLVAVFLISKNYMEQVPLYCAFFHISDQSENKLQKRVLL